MKKIINKNNIYKLIIFITLLSVVCIYTAHQINAALFSLAEEPYYTNLYNIDNKTLSIQLTENWKRNPSENTLSFTNNETTEELLISFVEENKYNVNNFETIKALFKLEFKDSYDNNLDLKTNDINYSNNNDIFAITFNLNGKYNIVGIEKVDDELIYFSYKVSSSSNQLSKLTTILDSIKISTKNIQGDEPKIEEN